MANVHDKIIKMAAKEVLAPLGVFQKGQSRTWIDDNGWFFTIIEFQPSQWGKGAYLNVGMHFLWNSKDSFSFDYGGREHENVSYTGDDEKFYKEMLELARLAKEKVMFYRSFSALSFAKGQITKNHVHSQEMDLWNSMMICFLSSDFEHGRHFFQQVVNITKDDYRGWVQAMNDQSTHQIAPILSHHERLQKYVFASIQEGRCCWRGKSSMSKLKVDERFG